MSRGKPRPRRKRGGMLASTKNRVSKPTPWWQWVIGIPVLLGILIVLGLFVWVTFIRPDLAVNIKTAHVPVIQRGENAAGPPQARHYLTVNVSGENVKLFGPKEKTDSVTDSETVAVRYTKSTVQGISVIGWDLSRPKALAPATP